MPQRQSAGRTSLRYSAAFLLFCLSLSLQDISPGCRFELVFQRKKPLIHIHTEHRVKTVGGLHLCAKTHNDDNLLIRVVFSQPVQEFIRNLGGILYDLLAQFLKKFFIFGRFKDRPRISTFPSSECHFCITISLSLEESQASIRPGP